MTRVKIWRPDEPKRHSHLHPRRGGRGRVRHGIPGNGSPGTSAGKKPANWWPQRPRLSRRRRSSAVPWKPSCRLPQPSGPICCSCTATKRLKKSRTSARLCRIRRQRSSRPCGSISLPARRKFAVEDPLEAARVLAQTGIAALAVDSKTANRPAGTGVPLDWRVIKKISDFLPIPLILAGGLTVQNVSYGYRTGPALRGGYHQRGGKRPPAEKMKRWQCNLCVRLNGHERTDL